MEPLYVSSFRDRELKIWESGGGYQWSVTNSGNGEAIDLESAMVAAAQAAGADWGSVKWRGANERDDDDECLV